MKFSATIFAALTYHAGIKGAICCVALLNRLNGEQVGNYYFKLHQNFHKFHLI